MTDASLKRATLTDLDATCALLRAQFAEHAHHLNEAVLRRGVEGLLSEPTRGAVILAIEAGRSVGMALLAHTWTVERGGLVAWLEELYVVPDRREAGIGTKLLTAAIALCREGSCLAMELEVAEEQARAANLYRRAGFQPLARQRHWLQLRSPS